MTQRRRSAVAQPPDPQPRRRRRAVIVAAAAAVTAVVLVAIAVIAMAGGRPQPSPTPRPSSPATAAAGVGSGALSHAAPDLERTLPREVLGRELDYESFTGDEAARRVAGTAEFKTLLDVMGARPDTLQIAESTDFTISSLRLVGADPARLEREFVAAVIHSGKTLAATTVTRAGRQVTQIASTSGGGVPAFILAHGDAIYFVRNDDPSFVDDALRKLP